MQFQKCLGTNGGVSWVGLIVSALGGGFVGLLHYITLLYSVDSVVLELAAPQWPIILIGAIGGLIGSLVDSILGATLQYSGIITKILYCSKNIFIKQLIDNVNNIIL